MSRLSSLAAGLVGGLVAVAIGAVLLVTGVIDGGDGTQTVVKQAPITQPAADESGDLTVNDIYQEASPGVVFIEAEGTTSESPFGPEGQGDGTATGSGFVLDREGFVLTNAHVVDGAKDVTVRFGEDDVTDAEVIGSDLSSDLAVLKVNPDEVELDPIEFGDSKDLRVGDPAIAIGNPFGFDQTVTTGIVSALQRQIQAPNGFSIDNVIQTDASINPGNSGGPLLDGAGRVIGINSQIATGGGGAGSVGIGFAVPIDTAKEVIPQLKDDGEVERAFLGVTTAAVDEQLAADLNLPAEQGALIQDVTPKGPAEEAGLRAGSTETADGLVAGGDLIVGVDGMTVLNPDDVAAAIADNQAGDTVEIEYFRDDERQTTDVELGERPARAEAEPSAPGGGSPPDDSLPFPLP